MSNPKQPTTPPTLEERATLCLSSFPGSYVVLSEEPCGPFVVRFHAHGGELLAEGRHIDSLEDAMRLMHEKRISLAWKKLEETRDHWRQIGGER